MVYDIIHEIMYDINTLKVARKSALVKVADSGIAALRIVSVLVWVISPWVHNAPQIHGGGVEIGEMSSAWPATVTILHRLKVVCFIQSYNQDDKS